MQWLIRKGDKMKKVLVVLCIFVLMILTACSSQEANTDKVNAQEVIAKSAIELETAIAEGPFMVTSAGQSADFDIAMTLLDKTGISYDSNSVLEADELGGYKTIVVAVGGSSKGLGAAGIDVNDELDRVESVLTYANDNNIKVIALHTGGEGRRGDLSDKFISGVLPYSDYIVAVATGDTDGFMSNMAIENDIPMTTVDTIADVIEAIKKAII